MKCTTAPPLPQPEQRNRDTEPGAGTTRVRARAHVADITIFRHSADPRRAAGHPLAHVEQLCRRAWISGERCAHVVRSAPVAFVKVDY